MEHSIIDYRALVRCLIDHTAGENDLRIKVAALQRSYDRRQAKSEPTIAEKISRRVA